MPQAFNCTMCSAPLDLSKSDGATILCRYCGNSSILPEELRDPTRGRPKPSPGGTILSLIDRGLKLAEVGQMLHTGNKIGAIRLYRESFGGSLQEAKDAVERMERDHQAAISQAGVQANVGAPQQYHMSAAPAQRIKVSGRKVGFWIGIFVLVMLAPVIIGLVVAFKAVTSHMPSDHGAGSPSTTTTDRAEAPGFASVALEFGDEGIGAGQFKDTRSVAVDGDGRIYVGEYQGGRIQVFDPQGKFVTQWTADKGPLMDLDADRKGVVYVSQGGSIKRYNGLTGEVLGEVAKPEAQHGGFYYQMALGLDGSVYAIGNSYNIVRVGPDNRVKSVVDVRAKLDENINMEEIAVGGDGTVYVIGGFEDMIFKFSPEGKFINRFGGRGSRPDQFVSPNGMVVDGKGRLFVSDSGGPIRVFEGDGRYLDSFGDRQVVYGLAANDKGEVFAAARNRHKIIKYSPNQ